MRSFFTLLLAICCVVMLILGNSYWQKKTSAFNHPVSAKNEPTKHSEIKTNENETNTIEETSRNELISFTKNWPTQASKQFNKKLIAHEPFKFLIVGSKAIGTSSNGWAHLLKTQLNAVYGKDNINININPFDTTSTEFINYEKQKDLVDQKADLVLFEPFTLNDNGFIPTKNSLANISKFMGEYKKENPETTFILLPPHPIYNAKFYPKQVADLADFAERKQVTFIDHWSAWPSPKSANIKNYLLPDQSAPNEKGAEIINEYLSEYFISK
ncbi:SGNH/GDSL hydrolase family protein [Neobacillus drentensis]|uniref:SGNH/GDSL hydrolase family protein n=1 Tax=Neobacillus drentensis TaxID=220684 RepID=UPI002FFEBAD7